jgi:basic amino acid/polyamine antiporter, APA family
LELKRQLGLPTSILIIIASMIGTGIFITTGEVLAMSMSAFSILILWFFAGIVAICGSLCYAELATMWPHVGGEYIYLKKTFGLLPSFLTGWISLVVGFSASVAISAMTFIDYFNKFWVGLITTLGKGDPTLFANIWTQKLISAGVILLFGAIHIHGVKSGSRIQNILTILKLTIVLAIIFLGLYVADWSQADRLVASYPIPAGKAEPGMPIFGLIFLIIMFSFSGWNGASYIAGEIKNPEKILPKALFWGTLLTMIIYLALNVVFLISAPGEALMGKQAIGVISAKHLFGGHIYIFFALAIAIILLSSISVEMMIGPRVYYAMAKDNMTFKHLGRVSKRFQTPSFAILTQTFLSIIYVFIGNATMLMEYMGFALGIFPILTVIGLVYLRIKHPEIERPYRVPFFPVIPLIYILSSSVMMIAGFMAWTYTSKVAIGCIILGIVVFYIWQWVLNRKLKK